MPPRPRSSCARTMLWCVLAVLVLLAVCAVAFVCYTRGRTASTEAFASSATSGATSQTSCPYATQTATTPLGCVTYEITSEDIENATETAEYSAFLTPRDALCNTLTSRFGTTADRIHKKGSDEPYCRSSAAIDLAADGVREATGASELPLNKNTTLTICPQASFGNQRCIYTQVPYGATTTQTANKVCTTLAHKYTPPNTVSPSSSSIELLPYQYSSSPTSVLLSPSPPSTVTAVTPAAFDTPTECTEYANQADDDIGQIYEGQLVKVCGTPTPKNIKIPSSAEATGTCSTNSIEGCRVQCHKTDGCTGFTYEDNSNGCVLLNGTPSPLQNVGTTNNTSTAYTCTPLPSVTNNYFGIQRLGSSTCDSPRTGVGCADDTCKYLGSASCTDDGVCAPPYGVYDAPTNLSPNVYAASADKTQTACRQKWLDAYEMALGKDNMEEIRNVAMGDTSDADDADASTWHTQLETNISHLCAYINT